MSYCNSRRQGIIALAIAKKRAGPGADGKVSYLREAKTEKILLSQERRLAKRLARENVMLAQATARQKRTETKTKLQIGTVPQAQAAVAAAGAAGAAQVAKLAVPNGFEIYPNRE